MQEKKSTSSSSTGDLKNMTAVRLNTQCSSAVYPLLLEYPSAINAEL